MVLSRDIFATHKNFIAKELEKMKRLLALLLALLLIVGLVACSSEPEPAPTPEPTPEVVATPTPEPEIVLTPITDPHGTLALRHLEFMYENLPNRFPFTQRERETAEWIMQELLDMGHDPANVTMQEFPINEIMLNILTSVNLLGDGEPGEFEYIPEAMQAHLGMLDVWSIDDLLAMEFLDHSQNVILTLPGTSETRIIVGAHYDSPNNAGISDNASGVSVLLESAERMLHLEHYYTITYVFFGAEEIGLVGVLHYVDALTEAEAENIALMVNVDVLFDGETLSYGVGYHDFATGTEGSSAISHMIEGIADGLNAEYGFGLVREPKGIYGTSDHLAFLFNGFDVLVLYSMDGFVPSPARAGMVLGILPEMTTARMELILAMLEDSDEPDTVVAIDNDRDALEQLAAVFLAEVSAGILIDVIQEQLEMLEAVLAETDDEAVIAVIYPEFEMFRVMMIVLEHPELANFTPTSTIPAREEGNDTPVGGPGFGFVLHTENDSITFMNAIWPGLIERALEAYSVFLESVLTLPAGSLQ